MLVVGLDVLLEIFVRHSSKLRVLNLDPVELLVVPRCDLLFKSLYVLSLDINLFLLTILSPRYLLGLVELFGVRVVSSMPVTRIRLVLTESSSFLLLIAFVYGGA